MRDAREKLPTSVIAEPLEPRCLLSVDVTPPTVRFVLHSFMTAPQWIAVTYKDDVDLNFGSANRTDVRIVGPNGLSAIADNQGSIWAPGTAVSSPYRLKYGVPAPGGSWDPADNGRYEVWLTRGVKDASGNTLKNLHLGHFDVALSSMGRAQGYVEKDNPLPMANVRVYVDANDDSVFNSGELNVLSNASGFFVFRQLPIGTYRIRQMIPAGFQLLKSLLPGASIDDAGTGGIFDITVAQSTISEVGTFINSLIFLDVNGTAAADQITVAGDAAGVIVTINGVSEIHGLAEFNALRVRGGAGDDVITIDAGINTVARLYGDDGNDTIRGGGGKSTIRGGNGKDQIFGGNGNDWIAGGSELLPPDAGGGVEIDFRDTIRGGGGNDLIYGGRGDDQIFGDSGNDRLVGGFGAVTIRGGDGNDWMRGGAEADQLFGENGDDTVIGLDGKDNLFGGSGNDALRSDDFNWIDVLDGGSGNDNAKADAKDEFLSVEIVKVIKPPKVPVCPLLICSGNGCFLTSAMVHWAGKADDCRELRVLRQFRDGYMRALPDGEAMIRDYYQHAPRVVEAIEQQNRGDQEWPRVYAMVQEALGLIEAGRNREALELYAAEYLRLKAEYVEAAVV